MAAPGADVELDVGSIMFEGILSSPPGEGHDRNAVSQQGPAAYDWQQVPEGSLRGLGPDGKGFDEHITSAQQFTECITEVTSLLTSLDSFDWDTVVTPMPRGVIDALARLDALTDLRITFSIRRSNLDESE